MDPSLYCNLSSKTIEAAEKSGHYTPEQINYMYETRNSGDVRDVRWHRTITNDVNPSGSERPYNNFVAHPLDYKGNPPGQWKKLVTLLLNALQAHVTNLLKVIILIIHLV